MKGKTAIISLVILILSTSLYAQKLINRARLRELTEQFDQKYRILEDEANQYAIKHGIPVRQVLPNGNVKELQFIDNGRPVYFETQNIDAAFSIRTNELWNGGSLGLSLDGSGYSQLGLWDEAGVRTSHDEFTNNGSSRVLQQDKVKSVGDHSTHVAGTLVAGGAQNNAKGMAYNGTLKAWDWTRDVNEMVRAASKGLEISNHSYGFIHGWRDGQWYGDENVSTEEDYWFGFYSQYSQELDEIAYNAPYYLIVKSAGNDRNDVGNGTYPPDGNGGTGYDCVGTRAIAKNILTVGAVEDVGVYSDPSSVIISEFSSWGPADDGRIKPDIVANGVDLYSPVASGDSDYGVYYGTSMSTPNAAGSMALLQQHYQNTHGGASMRAATLKALVIHTADEAGPNPGPDYMFGWGLMNAERAAIKISEDEDISKNVIEELALNNNESYSREITTDGSQALVVTIVWTDPSGTPLSPSLDPINPMLVNDLDLSVQGNTNTYFPWKLDMTNPSSAATNLSENNVDNVETVFIASPIAGTYTIQVSHDGILESPQYYSMIISGISTVSPQYCNSHGNATGEWIENITIGTTTFSTGSSDLIGYQDRTGDLFNLEANTIYPFSMTPGFNPRSKFEYWSVWIDFNNNDVFDDPEELVFSAGKDKSVVNGTISIPDIAEIETRMRVSMSRSGIPGPCDILEYGEVEDYTIHIGDQTLPTEYCISRASNIDQGWISSVSIGTDFTNDEPTIEGYTDFTDLQISLVEGETYDVFLIPGYSGRPQKAFWRIWIDYNGDLDFVDPGEEVFVKNNTKSNALGSFTVPPVSSQTTRMRISMSIGIAPSECIIFEQGEVEDYSVSLSGSLPGGDNSKSGIISTENSISQSQLSIYPNPSNNWLNIHYSGELEQASLNIYNIQGAEILKQEITSNLTTLDISKLESGIYHLALKTGDRIIYRKIVKQ